MIALFTCGIVVACSFPLLFKAFKDRFFQDPVLPYDETYFPDSTIDHTDVAFIREYLARNPQVAAEIKLTSWFFAHASVGNNLLRGIEGLKGADPDLFQLSVSRTGEYPPDDTESGVIYEIDRGNPGALAKIELFETYLAQNGWGLKVGAAVSKFCYIDDVKPDQTLTAAENQQAARTLASDYVNSMENLESRFPAVSFVYTTMPVTRDDLAGNYMRLLFNNEVRGYCAKNQKILFDIADIESHDQGGKARTGTYEQVPVEMLVFAYTNDGGHLSDRGQKQLAKGWYAVAAFIAAD